jgi:decaprenyl-phosphate phosphoribosyltransferase
MVALVAAMRPKQWVKNVLVAVAPAAAGTLLHPAVLLRTIVAFVAFSLVASGLYLVNDIRDVEADRVHPRKSRRPIASGALPIPIAWPASGVLLVAGIALGGFAATWQLAVTLVAYAIITTAYSMGLKTVPVIELACVASGFVLRATGGGAATGTRLSVWFVVVISFGALFIATGKRLAEMPTATSTGEQRAVLGEYTRSFLQSTLILCATTSITGYCLWAFESTGIVSRAHGREVFIELTVVPVVIGALHVLRLLDRGDGGAPEDLAYHDRLLQGLGIVWVALMLIGLYA